MSIHSTRIDMPADGRADASKDGSLDIPTAQGITVVDPRDGSLVGTVPAAGRAQIEQTLRAARAATAEWGAVDPAERGRALARLADAVAASASELATLNERETGRPFHEALAGVMAGVDTLRQYAELGPLHRTHSLRGARSAIDYTLPEPRGVVVAITPWNDPVAVALGLVGAALVTGNAVIHKPSERCPHLGSALGDVLQPLLPAGVFATLSGGPDVGAALVGSAEVDMIAHVGSTATGERIARAAAATGAHVIRENGGNDVLLVDGDVDPSWAADQAAIGAFSNVGQICTAVERILVHRAIAEPFLQALVARARSLNEPGRLAPLVDERMRQQVHAQVSQAIAAGARLLEGGSIPEGPGSRYPATVLADTPLDSRVMTDETFGPVAPVQVVDDFEQGLAAAVGDRYGLAATVLSGTLAHINAAITRLPVGTVKVNAVFGGAPGGAAEPRRASGSGFGYGPELLDEMTTRKVVHIAQPVLRQRPA